MSVSFTKALKGFALVSACTSAANIILMFALSKMLPIDVFGDFSYYYNIYVMLGNITPFGATLAVTVFRYKLGESSYRRLIFENLFIFVPLVLLFYLIVLSAISSLFHISVTYYLVVFLSYFSVYPLVLAFYYSVNGEMKSYGCVMLSISFSLVIGVLSSVLFFGNSITVTDIFLGFLISSFFVFFFSMIKLWREFGSCDHDFNIFRVLQERFKYGIFVVSSSAAMSLLVLGDKILLRHFVSASEFGAYAVASLVASTTLFVVNNFASAWGNVLARTLSDFTPDKIKNDFLSYQRYILFMPLASLIVIFPQLLVLNLFYNSYFDSLCLVVICISVSYALYAVSKFYIGYMNYYGYNSSVLCSSVLAILLFLCSFFISDIRSVDTMLASMLIAFLVQLIYCTIFVNKVIFRSGNV